MPRRAEYESNAERQRAYRNRKRGESAERDNMSEPKPREVLPRTALVTVEEYVALTLDLARKHHEETSPEATLTVATLEGRLARAEAYARWRYQAFLAGEVNSL